MCCRCNRPRKTSGPHRYDAAHQMTDSAPETPQPSQPAETAPKRFLFLRKRTAEDLPTAGDGANEASAAPVVAAAADSPAAEAGNGNIRPGVLRRRRRQLMGTYEQGIFDLGGLAMELHSRGLLAEDVLRRRAAEVADVRGQLDDLGAQIDDLRQARQERRQAGRGASVTCPACGARSRSGANFCASCGSPLQQAVADHDAPPEADQPTIVIVDEQVTSVIIEAPGDPQDTSIIPPADGDAR